MDFENLKEGQLIQKPPLFEKKKTSLNGKVNLKTM
jgi:hypothetical protein